MTTITTNIKNSFTKKNEICLNNIVSTYEKYPDNFIIFCNKNKLSPPKISSNSGQCLCLLLFNKNKYATRKILTEFCKKINMQTVGDVIQYVNKTEQWGLKRSTEKRGYYKIPYPYKTITVNLNKRKNFKLSKKSDKNSKINSIKKYIKHYYLDVPNIEWQLGHKNPEIEDNTQNNLILQPPIQSKYRDRFIFFDVFTKMPTIKELEINIDNYYNKEQQIKLLSILTKKFSI